MTNGITNNKNQNGKYVSLIFFHLFTSAIAACSIACVTLLCLFGCPFWQIILSGLFASTTVTLWFFLAGVSLEAY